MKISNRFYPLNSDLVWREVATSTNKETITLPSGLEEISILVQEYGKNFTSVMTLPVKFISTNRFVDNGGSNSGTHATIVRIYCISNNSFRIENFFFNGQDQSNNCKIYVYGR